MSEIWYNLGVLYEFCKQPNEAMLAYQRTIDSATVNGEVPTPVHSNAITRKLLIQTNQVSANK
jgi:hypothetical protein